jgi:small subunit ribosomal protein S3Ae
VSKTSYAKASQCRAIRKKMVDIMSTEANKCDLVELVKKL